MNAAVGRLGQTVVVATLVASAITGVALALAVPRFFLVDDALMRRIWGRGAVVGLVLVIVLCVMAWRRVHRHRFTLRALGLGSQSVEPDALIALNSEPIAITSRAMVLVLIAALVSLIPGYRSERLEWDTSLAIVLVSLSFSSTAALSLHTFLRRRISRALMLAPEDTMREAIDRMHAEGKMPIWTVRRILITVLVPVALVGFSAALIVHGYVRAFEAEGRLVTAMAIAHGSLEPIPGLVGTAGEQDACKFAEQHGYSIRLYNRQAPFNTRHFGTDRVMVTVPLEFGHAKISFRQTTALAATASAVLVAVLASLLVAAIGMSVGKALAADLDQAHRQVRMLGTDKVMRGSASVARPARFTTVARLGVAIEHLAERFRVFASAQETAIIEQDRARNMRGLLFASVSHDLKGSLNAVLGFADLIEEDQLTEPQLESLQVIRRRGRELLGLIRTILDGARVEAGQVTMNLQLTVVSELLQEAVTQSREQLLDNSVPIILSSDPMPWLVNVDPDRIIDALRSLIRHGANTSGEKGVMILAAPAPSHKQVLIDIEIADGTACAATLQGLLLAEGATTLPGTRGGLGLELSLARSLIELNGGSVQAIDKEVGVLMRVSLPSSKSAT